LRKLKTRDTIHPKSLPSDEQPRGGKNNEIKIEHLDKTKDLAPNLDHLASHLRGRIE
jgi:hypothetical protein